MSWTEISLPGLQGSNLLGFLAALGTLRASTRVMPRAHMKLAWRIEDGFWCPVLQGSVDWTPEIMVEALMPILKSMSGNPALAFADDLALTSEEFGPVARSAYASATPTDHLFADFIASFGCEALSSIEKKNNRIQDTALRTMSGAGHQHFLSFMRELVDKTEAEHLLAALFRPWQYADDKPSMRWDPMDDRRYALRWKEPSGDAVKTVRGANRLAIEALPLFPTAPVTRTLATTGFTRRPGKGVLFTWPIWETPATLDTARSLVALSELQESVPDRTRLRAIGVVEVYQSQRITQGKYRNFTPGRPV